MCGFAGQNLCAVRHSEVSYTCQGQKAEQGAKAVDDEGKFGLFISCSITRFSLM